MKYKIKNGFTLIELLVVIIVIGILATLTFISYNGVQQRARQSQIDSDLKMIKTAIITAREKKQTTLSQITNNFHSINGCLGLSMGTNPLLNSVCQTAYTNALNKISLASGIDINSIKDPWGYPYVINENEGSTDATCQMDRLGYFNYPYDGKVSYSISINLSGFTSRCN